MILSWRLVISRTTNYWYTIQQWTNNLSDGSVTRWYCFKESSFYNGACSNVISELGEKTNTLFSRVLQHSEWTDEIVHSFAEILFKSHQRQEFDNGCGYLNLSIHFKLGTSLINQKSAMLIKYGLYCVKRWGSPFHRLLFRVRGNRYIRWTRHRSQTNSRSPMNPIR